MEICSGSAAQYSFSAQIKAAVTSCMQTQTEPPKGKFSPESK